MEKPEPSASQSLSSSAPPSLWDQIEDEVREVIKLAAPIIVTSFLSTLMTLTDIVMVGHLGREELAAAALGNAFYNTFWFPVTGLATALDTLLSQSYGAKNLKGFGQWFVTGSMVMTACTLPIGLILTQSHNLLSAMGHPSELVEKSSTFVSLLLPGLYFQVAFLILTKYLMAQHILLPSVIIAAAANVMNVIFNYFLIYKLGWGFEGAPTATVLSRFVQLVSICWYLYISRRNLDTWPEFAQVATVKSQHAWQFFRIGISGWAMVAIESSAFICSNFLAAYKGATALAAHGSMLNFTGFTYLSFPLAISIAASIRVGSLLGGNQPEKARLSSAITTALTLCFMTTIAACFVTFRKSMGYLMSDDPEVVHLLSLIAPISAAFQLLDGFQTSIAGVFRGMGKQGLVACMNLVAFWVIGITVGVNLTFHVGGSDGEGLGVGGLWWGLASGCCCTSIVGAVILSRVDWQNEAKIAFMRGPKSQPQTPTHSPLIPSLAPSLSPPHILQQLALQSEPSEPSTFQTIVQDPQLYQEQYSKLLTLRK